VVRQPGGRYILHGPDRVPTFHGFTANGHPRTVRRALEFEGSRFRNLGPKAYVTIHRRHEDGDEVIKIKLDPLLDEGVNDEPMWPDDTIVVHDPQ
jgi:hypothetical protein